MPKICRQCGKLFNYEDYKYKDTIYSWRWNKKMYCSTECEHLYNRIKQKKNNPYKLAETEHNNGLVKINEFIHGEIVHQDSGSTSGGYFADIIKDDKYYELQMLSKCPLLVKARKWNKDKQHILIVAVPEDARKKFDEVYFFNGSELVRIVFSETVPK